MKKFNEFVAEAQLTEAEAFKKNGYVDINWVSDYLPAVAAGKKMNVKVNKISGKEKLRMKGKGKDIQKLLLSLGWNSSDIKRVVTEAFRIDNGTTVKMKDSKGKELYGKVVATLKVMGKAGVTVKWNDGTKGNFKNDQFASVSMDRKADYQISESVVTEAKDDIKFTPAEYKLIEKFAQKNLSVDGYVHVEGESIIVISNEVGEGRAAVRNSTYVKKVGPGTSNGFHHYVVSTGSELVSKSRWPLPPKNKKAVAFSEPFEGTSDLKELKRVLTKAIK